ncbi:MAG: cyclopropane fatty acyl phospholipid synthase [Syntrophales bacterium]|jgi:cyclopropane-fatty-acyl-phospholipid synthase|nr:cyclopropane fatty acyl phospholipid synthase [Syntrophales bacterium]MCK9528519.1 cyclopropane fatty acyl phospholipid synthase [Syntrophales bacterium]MDX9922855.1 cyclopropane fatty acyl phospholipid synthase [Syntrophales bacterium]
MEANKRIVERLLAETGTTVNGSNPWDIQVHDDRFYSRVLRDASLGLGESYMEGWWDCPRIDELICRILAGNLEEKVKKNLKILLLYLRARMFNLQTRSRAGIIARRHYDLDNEFFLSFLDSYDQYSCGYFEGTDDLEEAQQKKMDLLCRKLDLKSSDHVLDIGCGWGGFARYAAEHYGCTVTAVNISEEQIRYAREQCAGLPVKVISQDYRSMRGSYDKIVSVGMIEHVGQKNYRTFMRVADRCLKEGGIFLLHTIGGNQSRINCDLWINRYIFPNGMLPSVAQLGRVAEGRFVVEDIHNLGTNYEKTLLKWNDRFQKSWPRFASRFDETFKRMWEYYLLSCAGAFRARSIQVWQIVLTKPGIGQQYRPVR